MDMNIPKIAIDTLIEKYEALLFDAYGVLVHSTGALPGARTLITKLNRTGKPYYILTNDASKLPNTAADHFQGFGLDIDKERIVSSGGLIKTYFATHHLAGQDCIVLGPQDSIEFVKMAGGNVVAPASEFAVLVIADEAGFPFLETVDKVLTTLCRLLDTGSKVHLVLPNPDLIYPKDDNKLGVAAGSIAAMFEATLAMRYPERPDLRFVRLGKPEAAIFKEAFLLSGTRNMVMIGDQLETDIRGALNFGIDGALVASGVTSDLNVRDASGIRPTFRLQELQ